MAGLLLISTSCICAAAVDAEISATDRSRAFASNLYQKKWIHGSADCKLNADPAIEVFRYDRSSYILRQNKCLGFEAPFIFVLLGEEKVLVLDTGATENAVDFPLYKTVRSLIRERSEQDGKTGKEILVIHWCHFRIRMK
ncbi:MAG: hypothetical protein E2O52_05585 [Gammaproteobacteria bacterium]|nr:MAG: hypothetical protein E2O52_05585 [Gammaproteobacteria bacterium]